MRNDHKPVDDASQTVIHHMIVTHLKGGNDATHDGSATIAVVVDTPVQDAGPEIGENPARNDE